MPTNRRQYNKGGSTGLYVQHPERAELLCKFTQTERARINEVPATLVADRSAMAVHEALDQGIDLCIQQGSHEILGAIEQQGLQVACVYALTQPKNKPLSSGAMGRGSLMPR